MNCARCAPPAKESNACRQLVGYRTVGVFDLAQTDAVPGADPLPLEPPSAPITGDSHAHLLAPLNEHSGALGYTVLYEAIADCAGYCDRANHRIAIRHDLAPNSQVRVLVHELCHAHGADYATYQRAACEVIIDCATQIACATVGLAVSGNTIPYIAGWGEPSDVLTAVTTLANVIDGLASTIEAVLRPV
jgi:hypothetical protein